jgi:hypothetical protein
MNKSRARALLVFRTIKWLAFPATAVISAWKGWLIASVATAGLFAVIFIVGLVQTLWLTLVTTIDRNTEAGIPIVSGLP